MSVRAPSDDPTELLLERVWFEAERLERVPNLRIHPDDEMARVDLLKIEATPARRRLLYMRTGQEARLIVRNAVHSAGKELATLPSVLDFACGYGRVLRFLRSEAATSEFYASDIVAPAVDFVNAELGVRGFHSAIDPRDIVFPRRFALITVHSLFSHLPAERFGQFLRVLYDQLEPDGLLFFSTLSQHTAPAQEFDRSGFLYKQESGIPHLDVNEYGTTFVTPEVVRGIARTVGIEHFWCLERELWRIQDIFVVAKCAHPGLERWTHTALPRGAILKARLSPTGVARAEGYVRTPASAPAVQRIAIRIDGAREFECAFRRHPLPLPESEGGRHFVQTDWYIEGPAPELLGGTHAIAAVAELANGASNCFDAALLERG